MKTRRNNYAPHLVMPQLLTNGQQRAEPRIAPDRGSARGSSDTLLTVDDVARILQVPVSWVYDHTRASCHDPLPVIKLGKYVRFSLADIQAYLERERTRYGR